MRYDYVIAGAGSAGCVLAHRLSADPRVRVLLLEAGGGGTHPMLSVPLLARSGVDDPRLDWRFASIEDGLDGRALPTAAGKGLGGSSAINFLAYNRGSSGDFDRWAHDGAVAWSWNEVLPYFRKLESVLGVTSAPTHDPLEDAVLAAVAATGYPPAADLGAQSLGFGLPRFTIANGRRTSTERTYLRAARARPNLTVHTHAVVHRILLEGTTARGVSYACGGRIVSAYAEREVLVCAGAIKSPQLLMLSGIGPAEHLRSLGIAPVVDLHAGDNLQNHVKTALLWRRRPPPSPFHRLMRFDRVAPAVARALLFGTGPATALPFPVQGFIATSAPFDVPDLEFIVRNAPASAAPWFPLLRAAYTDAFGIDPLLLHPESRGTVRLRSTDPEAAPEIRYNFLTAPADVSTLRDGFRRARAIGERPELDTYRGDELLPGVTVDGDADVDAHIRRSATGLNHVAGTCRMGTDDRAVVDPQLYVRGIDGLRVVDASVFPDLVSGHTNAAVMMVAERAAALILRGP